MVPIAKRLSSDQPVAPSKGGASIPVSPSPFVAQSFLPIFAQNLLPLAQTHSSSPSGSILPQAPAQHPSTDPPRTRARCPRPRRAGCDGIRDQTWRPALRTPRPRRPRTGRAAGSHRRAWSRATGASPRRVSLSTPAVNVPAVLPPPEPNALPSHAFMFFLGEGKRHAGGWVRRRRRRRRPLYRADGPPSPLRSELAIGGHVDETTILYLYLHVSGG